MNLSSIYSQGLFKPIKKVIKDNQIYRDYSSQFLPKGNTLALTGSLSDRHLNFGKTGSYKDGLLPIPETKKNPLKQSIFNYTKPRLAPLNSLPQNPSANLITRTNKKKRITTL